MGHLNSFSWCLKTLIKHTPPSLKLVLTETRIRSEILQVLMIQSSQPNSVTVGVIYAPLPVWQEEGLVRSFGFWAEGSNAALFWRHLMNWLMIKASCSAGTWWFDYFQFLEAVLFAAELPQLCSVQLSIIILFNCFVISKLKGLFMLKYINLY